MVRVRAAEFLGTTKVHDPMPTLLKVVNESTSSQEVLLAFNAVVYLRDFCGYAFDSFKVKAGESARRIDYPSGKAKFLLRINPFDSSTSLWNGSLRPFNDFEDANSFFYEIVTFD